MGLNSQERARLERLEARLEKSSKNATGFTADDRKTIDKLLRCVTKVNKTVGTLRKELKKANETIAQQNKVINTFKSHINSANYRNDAQEQYGRREALKVQNADELGDDPVEIMLNIAAEIEKRAPAQDDKSKVVIGLKRSHIHRCHFLGSKGKKKIICKFIPSAYGIRTKIILNKRHINKIRDGKFANTFITEDLTNLRSGMIWYIKNKLSSKFHKVHTRNGVIKMKRTDDDTNNGDWISVDNPDDLHKLIGDELNIDELNEGLRSFKILKDQPLPVISAVSDDSSDDDSDFEGW